MKLKEKAAILHYHRHRQKQFQGETPEALGWKNDASQQVRYRILAKIGDLNGCSILEPGCGYGDMLAFLDRRYEGIAYTGFDLVPEFLEAAARRYARRGNCRFFLADFFKNPLPRADYVLASGALGYRTREPDYYTRCIARFFEAADMGLGFNLLDRSMFSGHPLLTGHSREEILSFCRGLTDRVRVIRGYFEDDFTVFMYKP
jgi:SAM-dependent methyltransferase